MRRLAGIVALMATAACGRTALDQLQSRGRDGGWPSPGPGRFAPTGSMATPRFGHTATLLPSGQVLVAGGSDEMGGTSMISIVERAELYDPATGSFRGVGAMVEPRTLHTATMLLTGKVLIVGGLGGPGTLAQAELYDPANGQFTATGAMAAARDSHAATLLPDGQVLVTGGFGTPWNSDPRAQAELYDPASGRFSATGSMLKPTADHTATSLADGKVLVAGGRNSIYYSRAERYDPASGVFADAGKMTCERWTHTATLLADGKVLIAGGWSGGPPASYLAGAEVYAPGSGTFTNVGPMGAGRGGHTATLLPSGRVLVIGGWGGVLNDECLSSADLYDPASESFAVTGELAVGRVMHTATLLPSGKVLVAGGRRDGQVFASAELYF